MKKMKFLIMLLVGVFAGLISSCKDDNPALPDPTLTVGVKTIEMEAMAADKPLEVAISSNYPWKVSRPETDNWCTLTKESEEKLFIAVTTNIDTVERKTRITVMTGSEDSPLVSYIDLTQRAADPASLMLSADKLEFIPAGETKTITALSNSSLITYAFVGEDEGWCTIEIEESEISLTAVENPDQDERTAQVVFTVGEDGNRKSATLDIVQRGQKPYISTSLDTIRIAGGISLDEEIEVFTNLPRWQAFLNHASLKPVEVKVNGNKIRLTAGAYYGMSGTVSYVDVVNRAASEPEQKIVVLWEPAKAVNLSVKESKINFSKSAEAKEIEITSNYDFVFDDPGLDWLTVKKNGNKISLSVTASPDQLERTAEVIIKVGGDGNISSKAIQVVQMGTKPSLLLSVDNVALDENGTMQEIAVAANEDWGIEIQPEATSWLTVTKSGNDKLQFRATKAESSRSTVVKVLLGSGSNLIEKTVAVVQNKLYKVGEIYMLDGKKIGLVYAVSDGGAHGKVISLAEKKHGRYHNIPESFLSNPRPFEAYCKVNTIGPTGIHDGLENMNEVKRKYGNRWKEVYEAMAWCDDLDAETGNPGWYIPAYNELLEIEKYITGFDVPAQGSTVLWGILGAVDEAKALARLREINKLLTDAGGVPFGLLPLYDDGKEDLQKGRLYTSTEMESGTLFHVRFIIIGQAMQSITQVWIRDESVSDEPRARAMFKF